MDFVGLLEVALLKYTNVITIFMKRETSLNLYYGKIFKQFVLRFNNTIK